MDVLSCRLICGLACFKMLIIVMIFHSSSINWLVGEWTGWGGQIQCLLISEAGNYPTGNVLEESQFNQNWHRLRRKKNQLKLTSSSKMSPEIYILPASSYVTYRNHRRTINTTNTSGVQGSVWGVPVVCCFSLPVEITQVIFEDWRTDRQKQQTSTKLK